MWLLLALTSCGRPATGPIVFGAASLRDALEACLTAAAPTVRTSWGASSTLVRQVQQGARADLVLSAHPEWTSALDAQRRGLPRAFARNRLVLASPSDASPPTLAGLDDATCVVLGDPQHVPLGRHARTALEAAGVWERVRPKVVATVDASAAAAALAAGRCEIGVLYATDGHRAGLQVADALPGSLQPEIRYDAAPLTPAGEELAAALTAPPCQDDLRRAHFAPATSP